MNCFDDKELALRFKNNNVPSIERLLYFICFALLKLTPFSFPTTLLNDLKIEELLFLKDRVIGGTTTFPLFTAFASVSLFSWLITVIILIVGTTICYKTNKNGDNKEFVERFISVGFPVFVQTVVMAFIIGLVNRFIFLQDPAQDFGLIMLEIMETMCIANIVLLFYFFWRLNSSMKIASGYE